jgi:hypothetical protein
VSLVVLASHSAHSKGFRASREFPESRHDQNATNQGKPYVIQKMPFSEEGQKKSKLGRLAF